jgi:hypothetical protein
MTVKVEGDAIRLAGECPVEDAEVLLQHLTSNADSHVDWRGCEMAHAAVIQILLASKCALLGPPSGRFLRELIEPPLARGRRS